MNTFTPPKVATRPMVDLLFMVDNSGSMDDDQTILGSSFGSFIQAFQAKDVDAHFGVITTDTTAATASSGKYWSSKLPGYLSPGPGNLLTKYTGSPWLTHDDADLVNKFKVNSKVGTSGSGSEQGIQSTMLTLADAKVGTGGFNQGFLRDDAMLSLVFVTDEDDDITQPGVTPDSLIASLKARIAALKGPTSHGYSCDLVIQVNAAKPAGTITYPLTASVNPYPNVYLKMADQMGCNKIDINKNWGSDLAKIGYTIANQAQKEFKLTSVPIAGTLVVKVNGNVIAADATNGYIYHADRNTVELAGSALAASAGGTVTVTYKY